MKRVALALGLVLVGAGPVLAQYGYPPRPMMPVGPMHSDDIIEIVHAMGLRTVGAPVRSGSVYVQRAADYYGKPLRVIVDAHRAQVVSVEAFAAPGSIYGGPYAASGGPYWRRPYPVYGAAPPIDDDDLDYAPRQQHLPAQAQPPRPAAKSAAVTPARPPLPRKRPAAAPQEATAGSVEPLQPAPQNSAPAPAAEKPATPAFPPVAPLD